MNYRLRHANDRPRNADALLRPVLWFGVAILALIGVVAAGGRAVSVADGGALYEQFSKFVPAELAQETLAFDRWFAARPLLTLLHVVPGGLFLALAPLQFSARVRSRHTRLHRWMGRVLVVAALSAGLSALLLGVVFPYGGRAAAAAVFGAGTLFLVSLVRAFVAIRRGDVARHREWMIRMFALGIGISTVRVVGLVVFLTTGAGFQEVAGLAFWSGWLITFAAAESWIRHTRPRRAAALSAPVTVAAD